MLEAIKSVLKQAAQARGSGEAAEAERLYKEAAAEAKAKDDAVRAEALLGLAQTRRDQGDRTGASINYSEAIALLRSGSDANLLSYALRHAADVRSELREYSSANALIEEAIRLYRAADASALDVANALRVSALNNERQAQVAWREARELYASVAMGDPSQDAGVKESTEHLHDLAKHSEENA